MMTKHNVTTTPLKFSQIPYIFPPEKKYNLKIKSKYPFIHTFLLQI